jgi:hypothetical protein
LVPFTCGHYLRIGFDRLSFIDDGSTDGTYEFLHRLSSRDPRVSVRRVESPEFEQDILATDAANALIAEGFRLIFPFDDDAFWNIKLRSIRRVAHMAPEGVFAARWTQFVLRRFGSRARPGETPIVALDPTVDSVTVDAAWT